MKDEARGEMQEEKVDKSMSPVLKNLSPRQREAAVYIDGPLLILAGAGSGKTRVLTHKIAWLIDEKIAKPWEITAMTFTNKAAGEMRERVANLVEHGAEYVKVSTFHAFGLKFLFRNEEAVQRITGLQKNFTVFDRADCRSLLASVMQSVGLNPKETNPALVLEAISRDWTAWSAFEHQSMLEGAYLEAAKAYRNLLRERNAVDFDDLMILPLEILSQDEEVRLKEQAAIKWLLVDEYQDVNRPQYLLMKYLTGPDCIVNVVGDPDQAIYGWRGAEVGMILNFENDFKSENVNQAAPKQIILDENYRSTKNILAASNALIRINTARFKKTLKTSRTEGEKIYTLMANGDFQEADFIASEIKRLVNTKGYSYSDIAILYRQNAMSRLYEEKLLSSNVPYRIVRGLAFYDRKEVRDVLALLKLAVNPGDRGSFEGAAGFLISGMGPKRLNDWGSWLVATDLPKVPAIDFWTAVAGGAYPVKGQIGSSVANFAAQTAKLAEIAETQGISGAVDYILDKAGFDYENILKTQEPETWKDRLGNILELKSVVPDGDLAEALAEAALYTDADAEKIESDGESEEERDCVGLLTLHAAKGLEFPVVFIAGLEEDIFPTSRAKDIPEQLEEERRLFYVGITRAEERLYLTAARSRHLYGGIISKGFSRFLFEIPDTYQTIDDRHGDAEGWNDTYGSYGSYMPKGRGRGRKRKYNFNY